MAAEKGGFIKISRKLFDHELFCEKREFSRFEAWVDLIQICAYEDNNSKIWKGRIIVWGRGQAIASVRHLQQRWNWKSVDKVFSFLELLRTQGMIKTDNEQGIGRITLCKYDDYNDRSNTKRTQNRTVAEQSPNNIKEYKESKEIKERGARENSFVLAASEYSSKYSTRMIDAFVRYWTEWNDKKGKMKWELQETWELSKRLATWASREKGNGVKPGMVI